MMVPIGAIGHFILMIACLTALFHQTTDTKKWWKFIAGGVLVLRVFRFDCRYRPFLEYLRSIRSAGCIAKKRPKIKQLAVKHSFRGKEFVLE
jgi:hypothetical protein